MRTATDLLSQYADHRHANQVADDVASWIS
jgi:hypothetical protein